MTTIPVHGGETTAYGTLYHYLSVLSNEDFILILNSPLYLSNGSSNFLSSGFVHKPRETKTICTYAEDQPTSGTGTAQFSTGVLIPIYSFCGTMSMKTHWEAHLISLRALFNFTGMLDCILKLIHFLNFLPNRSLDIIGYKMSSEKPLSRESQGKIQCDQKQETSNQRL